MYKIIIFLLSVFFLGANANVYRASYLEPDEPDNSTNTANSTTQIVPSATDFRLPDIYEVKTYTLSIDVYLDEEPKKNFTFTGFLSINFDLKNDTNKIILHSENLQIKNAKSTLVKDSKIFIETELNFDTENNFLIITSKTQNFTVANYILTFQEYSGNLSDDFRGLYKSSYVNDKKKVV